MTTVLATSTLPHVWDLPGKMPAKPAGYDYGYVANGTLFGSTHDRLIEMVRAGIELNLVWTPETPAPVPPERAAFLLPAFHAHACKQARNAILGGAAFLVVGILLTIALQKWNVLYRNFFVVIGGAFIIEGIWQHLRSRNYSEEEAAADASSARFTAWIKKQKLGGYGTCLFACIIVVGVAQVFAEQWIDATGLVKPAVWRGEVWRLFTATLMHANTTHFWMNSLVLLHFGKIVERTLHRAFVPFVFLVAGGLGSIFSVVLYPHTTSIGASGGLMGLVGFITVASYVNQTTYPHKYFRQLIEAIVSVGIFGLLGFAFIDNAGHLGGLVGGLLLGWLFLRKRRLDEKLLTTAGVGSLLALGSFALFAVYRMLR